MNFSFLSKLPSYEVSRQVIIKSPKIAGIFWGLVLVLVGGALISLHYTKGFYELHQMDGTVNAILMGSGFINSNSGGKYIKTIFDALDITPTTESGAITVVTSISSIYNQRRSNYEHSDSSTSKCESDFNCLNDTECESKVSYIGKLTGKCSSSKFCEIEGWCPARFPKSSIIEGLNDNVKFKIRINSYFSPSKTSKHFNYIETSLKDLLMTEGTNFELVKEKGALFSVSLVYECYLKNIANCKPRLKILRLDNVDNEEGFQTYLMNYSKPKNFVDDDKELYYRDLHKITALRFIFKIEGTMAEFSLQKLILGVGSAVGLFSLANLIIENLILNYLEEGRIYKNKINVDLNQEKIELENVCREVLMSYNSNNLKSKKKYKDRESLPENRKHLESNEEKELAKEEW